MTATIRIAWSLATIDGYRWSSDNKTLEDLLNAMLPPLGPSAPDPDRMAAHDAAGRLDGEVIYETLRKAAEIPEGRFRAGSSVRSGYSWLRPRSGQAGDAQPGPV